MGVDGPDYDLDGMAEGKFFREPWWTGEPLGIDHIWKKHRGICFLLKYI